MTSLPAELRDRFATRFRGAPRLFFAPGRVNLIGAHLDYSGGDVLPLAVDRGVYVAARLAENGRCRVASREQEQQVEVATADLGGKGDPKHGWANFPLGVVAAFRERTGRAFGVDLLFAGDLPMASGLSSSAAIEVVTATALDRLLGTGLPPLEIALLAHRVENEFVGVKCGIMDQFASALGKHGHALLLHCRTQQYEHVPLDRALFEILVMDTRKPRPLAKTGFNQRVHECADAFALLCARLRPEPCLAEYKLDDLDDANLVLQGVHRKRVRHVVTEMARVAKAVACLRDGDIRGFGRMLDESQHSARVDYEVSCPELDVITAAARACEGVFGARLVGAGFGGCAIAVIAPGCGPQVESRVTAEYGRRFGISPAFYLLHAGPGPREIGPAE